jgi:co-chaperonin GroES (HSP10)
MPRCDPNELNPHGLIAIRDTAIIRREQDLTDLRRLDLLLPADDPRTMHLRQRVMQEKATGIGTVIAVGPGEVQNGERIKPEVQVGDRVLFGPFLGQDLKLPDGTEIMTMYAKDIRAILPPAAAKKP